jgi:polysaccharide biosynthesis transport protein
MSEPQKEMTALSEQFFNFWDLISTLKKRWLVIVSVFICVSFIGVYKTYQKTYMYRAQAKLSFALPESQFVSNYGGAWLQEISRPNYFSTQLQIIKSEPVGRLIVESLNLVKDTQDQRAMEAATAGVLSSLTIQSPKDTDIVVLGAVSSSPDMAMKIANAAAEAYIRYNEEKRYLNYRKSVSGITEQLADLEKKLEDSQKELIQFIEKENITSYGDTTQSSGPLIEKDEQQEIKSFIESMNNQKVGLEIEIARLLDKYYEDHPKVQKLRNDIRILDKKIEEQQVRVGILKKAREKEIILTKQKEIRYGILKRKVEINKQLYDTLMRKLKETDIGSEMPTGVVDIIEYAKKPGAPFSPNKSQEAIFSIILAILLGVGAGVAVQFIDSSFKSVEEIETYLKVPVLSTVPFLKKKGKKALIVSSLEEGSSDLKEAFRLLRTNLKFALSEKPGKVIIVTSSQKGEGKSTVTANLGITMAESGSKTLVVDADLRVRSIKNFFGITDHEGLSDYLSKEIDFSRVVEKTELSNLFVVPSGPNVENPAVLFESEKMKKFLEHARRDFEYVLFDAPPVGYIIDASILSMLTEGAIMVIEAGVVGKKTVFKAMEQLYKSKSHVWGVVFNKEAMTRKSYYYKYYRYYSQEKEKSA